MAYTEPNGFTLPVLVAKPIAIVAGQAYSFSQLFTLDLGSNPDPNVVGIAYQLAIGPQWTFSGQMLGATNVFYAEQTGPDALNYTYFSDSWHNTPDFWSSTVTFNNVSPLGANYIYFYYETVYLSVPGQPTYVTTHFEPIYYQQISFPVAPSALFTTGAQTVDFNNLTPSQKIAVSDGADLYDGQGGSDTVTLPTTNNYNEVIDSTGDTLNWGLASTFRTGSLAGEHYTVIGYDGNYKVALGAGEDTVNINGNGNSTITGGNGSGTDTITIVGTGNNIVNAGTKSELVSISGGGTLKIDFAFVGSATIGANSTLELNGPASGGTITFAGSQGTLKIDGTTMPTNVISGFVSSAPSPPESTPYAADTIDLTAIPYDNKGIATFYKGGNSVQPNGVLQIQENGSTYVLQLDPKQSYDGAVFALSDDGTGNTAVQVLEKAATGIDSAKYPGDASMAWLWANTNLSWTGYYLPGGPNLTNNHRSEWQAKLDTLATQGWTSVAIWVGYQDPGSSAALSTPGHTVKLSELPLDLTKAGDVGVKDAKDAINAAIVEGFAPGSVIYLDIEWSGATPQEQVYLENWANTLSLGGYVAGIYCPTSAADPYHEILPNAPIWVTHPLSSASEAFVPNDTTIFPEYEPESPVASAWQYEFGAGTSIAFTINVRGANYQPDLDSGNPVPTTSDHLWLVGTAAEGYLEGATVFQDANGNDKLDPAEASALTDPRGGFSLALGSGRLVARGGTDASTRLQFKGELLAPAGSVALTPLTTLLTNLASDPSAQQKVLSALGLSSDVSLTTFDPIAAAKAGSADGAATEVAGAKVYDTVALIASTLAAAGGTYAAGSQAAFSEMASAIGGTGIINLANQAYVSALIKAVAQSENLLLGQSVADSVAAIIVASNAALDSTLQADGPDDLLLNDVAAVEKVIQGTAANAIEQASNDPTQVQSLVGAFTGTNLETAVATARNSLGPTSDATPPILTPVADQTLEATSAAGAVTLFSATATDAVDGTDPVVFKEGNNVVHSGDTFALGIHTIIASSIDAVGNLASETFKITVADTTAPELTSIPDKTVHATSPGGASVAFTATASDVVDGTDPVVFKEGNNVVHSEDAFSFGAHTIIATATDTAGNTATESFAINVVDAAPILVHQMGAQSTTAGAAFSLALPSDTFQDPDAGDHLTLTAAQSDGSALPTWLTFDPATGTLKGTPASGGTFDVSIKATDPAGLSAVDSFHFAVSPGTVTTNHPPVITSDGAGATASVIIIDHTKYVDTVHAVDPDPNSRVTYSIVGGDDQKLFNIDAKTGALSFKSMPKDGHTYEVTVAASDGSLHDSQTLKVQVARGAFECGNKNEADTFVFKPGFGLAVVSNFDANYTNHDVLELDHELFHHAKVGSASGDAFDLIKHHSFQLGHDTIIVTDTHEIIDLHNTQLHSLSAKDFLLV
jgi:putative Ig domain-containing protein/glycoside hydrolase-like protein/cadherin domain-containing protein/HYR domain-containing protein